MNQGDTVRVSEFGGRELVRRVVADLGKVVVVCNESEYKRALTERRKPTGIGFPRSAVRDYDGAIDEGAHQDRYSKQV